MGSLVYAKAVRRRGDRIKFMVSLEMLGCYDDRPGSQQYPPLFSYFYPNRGNFIAFVSNLRSRRQLLQVVSAFRDHSDFPVEHVAAPAIVPGLALSDHFSFWRQRYPAIMITDTAFYRYRWYHIALDTPDRLHYEAFARVTAGLYRAFTVVAGADLENLHYPRVYLKTDR